jgi:hypothetical protein
MKSPAILFYTSDFLTGTFFMTNEETGMYIRLLCMQHQKGHLSESDMNNVCSTHENVRSKFIKDKQGNFYNERMENEIIRRENFCKSRSLSRLGAGSDNKNNKKRTINVRKTHDEHTDNDNNSIHIEIETKYNVYYDEQIKFSNNDENYIKFVSILFGDNPAKIKLENVLKMKDQCSFEQFKTIMAYKQEHRISLSDYLTRMNNWKDLNKKNSVLQSTLLNWIRKDLK